MLKVSNLHIQTNPRYLTALLTVLAAVYRSYSLDCNQPTFEPFLTSQ